VTIEESEFDDGTGKTISLLSNIHTGLEPTQSYLHWIPGAKAAGA
jgi:hypothetical protein